MLSKTPPEFDEPPFLELPKYQNSSVIKQRYDDTDNNEKTPPSGGEICARLIENLTNWWWAYLAGLIVIVVGWIIYFSS